MIEYNALVILADEFSTLLHKYDNEFMAVLTDIYEGDVYDQERRTGNLKLKIDFPTLNILAGTTPSNLLKFMPEGAWDQGFASRSIMVYSGDRNVSDIFEEREASETTEFDSLLYDLRTIASLYGRIQLSPEAIEAFRAWRIGGELPIPKHPKLRHYCIRRTAHVLRLSMVATISRGNSLQISREDFEEARGWLVEAEMFMPDIFTAGVSGGDSAAMDEAWYFVQQRWAKKKTVMAHELVHFIRERVPGHSVIRVIELMISEGSLKERLDAKTGMKSYEPGPRTIS